MLGQGLGPIDEPMLRRLASRALSRLDLLTLREGDSNLALLQSLGVPTGHAVVTGDDAIEAAYPKSPQSLGNGIGANLRLTRYAGACDDTMHALRDVLQSAAARHGAALVPVPISYNDDAEDVRVLRTLLGRDVPADESVQVPAKTVAAAASCRVVVTGSYHAAVFALSNGVPAVALAASPYYTAKFSGLRTQFDGGCAVVHRDHPGWPEELTAEIDRAWDHAAALRPALLAAAERQIELGRAAYRRMTEWFPR
jgi:colanic acid/amylovoran biosynthesis protein